MSHEHETHSNLLAYQQLMSDYLLYRTDSADKHNVLVDISRPQLGIYRNNVRAVCFETLADNFETVCRVVGEDCFTGMVVRFIAECPPDLQQLSLYGKHFPAFIDNLPELQHLPWLADVARLEWQMVESFNAPSAISLTASQVAAAIEAGLDHLALHPSCRLMSSPWPVVSVWQQHWHHREDDSQVQFRLDAGSEYALIFCYQQAARIRSLSSDVFSVLQAINRADDVASDEAPDLTRPDVIQVLAELITHGLFTRPLE
ncbi:HvfC/BufC family peptide modification chaperone [Endozoicomonadaceae bacterium StTr2]